MKKIVLLFSFILGQMAFSQHFGVIADKDGFVNVREKPSTKSEIKATIKTGEVVGISDLLVDEENPTWWWVEYQAGASFGGYVHKSRVKPLDNFPDIPFYTKQGNMLIFSNRKNIEISVSVKQISFLKDVKPYMSGKYGELYKGKESYGFDGTLGFTDEFPVEVFDKVTLKIDGKTIEIPQKELENLFIVRDSADGYDCYWDKERNRIFIESAVGDGAGWTALLFIFENGQFKEKQLYTH